MVVCMLGECSSLSTAKISIDDILEDAELLEQFIGHVVPKIDWAAEFKSFCAERSAQARAKIKIVGGRDLQQ